MRRTKQITCSHEQTYQTMIALERKTPWIGGLSTVDIKAEEGGSKVVGVLHPETMLHQGTLHYRYLSVESEGEMEGASIHPCIHPCLYPSAHPFVSVRQSICPSIHTCMHPPIHSTCSTTIVAKSLYISFISDIDWTMEMISLSLAVQ